MERRLFLLALAGIGVLGRQAEARVSPVTDFRTRDLMGGEFAIETSRLALSKTGNPDIINFANAEIAEQVQVANALAAVPGTAPMRSDHAALFSRLERTPSGANFDAMYVTGQIAGHRELLALNSTYLNRGGNPQERSVAEMSLPTIQRHLAILTGLRNIG